MEYNEYIYNILNYLKDLKIDKYHASNVFIQRFENNVEKSGILNIIRPEKKEKIIELVDMIKHSYTVCERHEDIENHYKNIYTLVKVEIKENYKKEKSSICGIL